MTEDSLARWLEQLDDARLTALVGSRLGAQMARLPSSFDDLAALLSRPESCHAALERVDRGAAGAAALVARAGGAMTALEVASELEAAPEDVEAALIRASAQALAWPDERGVWRAPPGLRRVVPLVLPGATWPRELAPPPADRIDPGPAPVLPALQLLASCRRLLEALDSDPVKPLVAGGLGVPVTRRLAKATQVDVPTVVLQLQLLFYARVVAGGRRAGQVTARGRRWIALPEEQAYVQLVRPVLHPRVPLLWPGEAVSGLLGHASRGGWAGVPRLRQLAHGCVVRGPESDASFERWADWSQWRFGPLAERVTELRPVLDLLERLALRVQGAPAPWLLALLQAEQPEGPPGLACEQDEDDADGSADPAAQQLAAHLPPLQDSVVLQADGTAFVAGRPDAALRVLLDQLGARESEHTWRLSGVRVRESLDAGGSADELLAELARRSPHAVPSTVERLVRDVAEAHGRVVVHGTRTVLRLTDPRLGTELLHDRRLAPLGLVELAPGVVASSTSPGEVVAALRAAGHAPVGDGALPPEPPPLRPSLSSGVWRWGHDAEEVVAHLRRIPARRPAPSPNAASGPVLTAARQRMPLPAPVQAAAQKLLPRLGHLSRSEAVELLRAVVNGTPIEIDYVDGSGNPTTRVVEQLSDRGHLLVGHCRLRQDERMFVPLGILGARAAR